MTSSGFDWLSLPNGRPTEDSHTPPPPPVSFGKSPSSSGTQSPSEVTEDTPPVAESQRQKQDQTQRPEIDFKNLFRNVNKNPSSIQLNVDARNVQSTKAEDLKSKEQEEEILQNFKDDSTVALSLTIDQLTTKEAKTYLRWYNDIITRRGTRTITLKDVFAFLNNFKILELHKKIIQKIFASCSQSLNIGQFFCVLRIISHAVVFDKLPSRALIKESSPVPRPISILARKRLNETEDEAEEEEMAAVPMDAEEGSRLNLDTFAQFMLTGRRPDSPAEVPMKRKKKNMKKVKFSDTVEIDPRSNDMPPAPAPPPLANDKLDYSLPMGELLGKLGPHNGVTTPPQAQENEEEELKDMEESISHFRNVNIDSVSIDGVPANIPSNYFSHSPQGIASPQREDSSSPQPLLQPNLTGSVSKSMRQGLGISSPPPPPPRLRSVSSPVQIDNHLNVPQPYQNLTSSPRVPSPLSFSNNGNNNETSINWYPNASAAPPPPPPRFRSSTLPSQSPVHNSSSPAPPPPRSRKASNAAATAPLRPQSTGPHLPPKLEVDPAAASLGFDDYFKNGNVYKRNSDTSVNVIPHNTGNGTYASNSSNDILGDLKALQQEVDRIKHMSSSGSY